MNKYSEQTLIEEPTKQLFEELGYEVMDCRNEKVGEDSTIGRETFRDVVLEPRLRRAIERLNPSLPKNSIYTTIRELTKDRSALHPTLANKEVHELLKDGVRISIKAKDGSMRGQTIKVIDWEKPENNDFFLASQFWVAGDLGRKRPDLIGFINGLPLVFVELKALHVPVKEAYDDNLSDYKETIPHLFWYNALTILSNGTESRIGTISSAWEHFVEWPKISSEDEPRTVSIETMIRGTCEKSRLLDLIENFILFTDAFGAPAKILAKNHQFLGVDNAIRALQSIDENKGRLGVFWHTQGSGKSYSMMFFSQKVLRKIPGNWSFVIVTDRQELDNQIYKTFADGGVITEPHIQATSSAHLRQLLREDHRFVFSLIHKFRTEPGSQHPVLSKRSDIIVITDEAHRSQYDTLANNMRNALPNASFLGFTGTPLIDGEERTKEVFGEYVSIYDYRQSVEDKATVPLYYENRIPELQLTNEDLNQDMEELLDEASLDEEQEKKVEHQFARQYHIITREDRLKIIAGDLVSHFMGRGHRGKAMVVSIDKATALRMYNYVGESWAAYKEDLIKQRNQTSDTVTIAVLDDQIKFMHETDMALVVSSAQNEGADMKKKGLDIVPHRKRMVSEDLDKKFKDPDDPFRIVFVCAMWMTGFDVPCCSTIYLDKPMRNHTLMQTMARANRVFKDKVNGLIVDYIGLFRDLEAALAIYGARGSGEDGAKPVLDKDRLVQSLRMAIQNTEEYCSGLGINLKSIPDSKGFELIQRLDDAVEVILANEDIKKQYLTLSSDVDRLFKAILPDARANEFIGLRSVIREVERKIRGKSEPVDIKEFMKDVETLLDRSIATEAYLIGQDDTDDRIVDLSKVDFEGLRVRFEKGNRKNTEVEKLRSAIDRALSAMIEVNRTRMDFREKFEELIAEYNAGSKNVSQLFDELVTLAGELNEEELRHIREGLTEEELAIFDILTRPDMNLSEGEVGSVKKVARDLLNTLKAEKLVLDWKKRQNTRADVFVTIERILDTGLPSTFDKDIYKTKCQTVFDHVYDSYLGEGRSVYEIASR